MSNSPIEALGGAVADAGRGVVTAADVLRLVYGLTPDEANVDQLSSLLRALAGDELKRLEEVLDEHREALSEADRQAFANRRYQEIAALMQRLRKAGTPAAAPSSTPRSDGLTHSKIRPAVAETRQPEHLPQGEPESVAKAPEAVAKPQEPLVAKPQEPLVAKPQEPLVAKPQEPLVARPQEPLVAKPQQPLVAKPQEPSAQASGRVEKMPEPLRTAQAPQMPTAKKPQLAPRDHNQASATPAAPARTPPAGSEPPPGPLAPRADGVGEQASLPSLLEPLRPPLRDQSRLASMRLGLLHLVAAKPEESAPGAKGGGGQKVLGESRPTMRFVHGYPASGRSGGADKLHLLELCPPSLRPTFEALGVTNLAVYLAGALLPAGRQVLSEASGVPAAALLLSAWRAELLDLPPLERRYPAPHIKDVILLSRLGIESVSTLAALLPVVEQQPSRLELLGKLVAAVQKADVESVGRQRLTRHDLRAWMQAATRRGTDIVIEALQPERPLAGCAERALTAFAEARRQDQTTLWHEVLERAYLAARTAGGLLDDHLEAALDAEADEVTRAELRVLRELQLGSALRSDREAAAREELREYERFTVADGNYSLFLRQAPRLRPGERAGRVGFWLDPVPDFRHVFDPARPDTIPEALKPAYVSIDPASGALSIEAGG
jgi:hypothetical protein